MHSEPRYLLIVGCSQRKRSDPGLIPAIERYDGGHFRVLRKAKADGYWPENLDVLILSAKYGLITSHTPIEYYDQRMTSDQARQLNAQTVEKLRCSWGQCSYDEVYVDLGQGYYAAIEEIIRCFSTRSVRYAEGRIGVRLAQLKRWLIAKYEAGIHPDLSMTLDYWHSEESPDDSVESAVI